MHVYSINERILFHILGISIMRGGFFSSPVLLKRSGFMLMASHMRIPKAWLRIKTTRWSCLNLMYWDIWYRKIHIIYMLYMKMVDLRFFKDVNGSWWYGMYGIYVREALDRSMVFFKNRSFGAQIRRLDAIVWHHSTAWRRAFLSSGHGALTAWQGRSRGGEDPGIGFEWSFLQGLAVTQWQRWDRFR